MCLKHVVVLCTLYTQNGFIVGVGGGSKYTAEVWYFCVCKLQQIGGNADGWKGKRGKECAREVSGKNSESILYKLCKCITLSLGVLELNKTKIRLGYSAWNCFILAYVQFVSFEANRPVSQLLLIGVYICRCVIITDWFLSMLTVFNLTGVQFSG